jgi:hypothetical protein
MKLFAIIAAIAAVIVFFSLLRSYKRQPAREFKTTDEFIQWLASEAVKDAQKENHITLDYSPESIKRVEQILGKLHEQYAKQPSSISVRGMAAAYGAYIGEVIRKSEPDVHWEKDDPEIGKRFIRSTGGQGVPIQWRGARSALKTAMKTMFGSNTRY